MKKQYFFILLSTSFTLFGAEQDNTPKYAAEIKRLNEQHALEIALWEKKVEDLMVEREKTMALKAAKEAASAAHNQQPVHPTLGLQKKKDTKSKK